MPEGQFTAEQQRIYEELVAAMRERARRCYWAVPGRTW